ncbi:MAG: hypothetical protein K8S16_12450 [Bacteroidales bacterium]|nr:hypothetical protein [Bacteroidales bacterium]
MRRFVKPALAIIGILLFFIFPLFADAPPDPGGDPSGGSPVGGGAPIGGGIFTFLIASAIYALRKIRNKLD